MNEAMILFTNARLLDGVRDQPVEGASVLVEGQMIREVSDKRISSATARIIDLGGRTLMPGLIDCHTHVTVTQLAQADQALLPDSLIAARASAIMHGQLMRGFTTVRDAGGADGGLKMAVEAGLFVGPRLVICGQALSQSGGHCDYRNRYDPRGAEWLTRRLGSIGRVCDGEGEVRKAVREEIRGGAQFIKIMANGGISTPTDPIKFLQFSRNELIAIVEEAANAQTYVAAHAYTDEAISRAIECGVKSIEHASLVTPATARRMVELDVIACPTLVVYEALSQHGAEFGFPDYALAKIGDMASKGEQTLKTLHEAGVPMAYGTDCGGQLHRHQSDEFVIRGRVLPAMEVIKSATSVAARLLRMEGQIGSVAQGTFADLIVVDGDPLVDLTLMTGQGRHLPIIMKDGKLFKNILQ
ncbi:MAG: amidohydrolase family protein [Rhizobiaceae bacterium]